MRFSTLRRHWPAFILAFLAGLWLALPALVGRIRYGVPFDHPINIRVDDEYFYLARIREVVDGHPTIGNAYLWEHKAKPSAPLFFGEWLSAQPLKLFGIGVVAGDVLYNFTLPIISVLLTYVCFFLLTKERWLSFAGTAFLFLGLFPNEFGRAVSPQLNFIFWLSQFILVYLIIRDSYPKVLPKKLIVLGAANFGLLFYLFPYYWTFYLILFALLVAVFFLRRDYSRAGSLIQLTLGGIILAIPYFWITLRALRLPEYTATLQRINMINSHFPSGLAIVAPGTLLVLIAIVLFRKGILPKSNVAFYLLAGIAAAMIAVNQHIITGMNFEFSSHYLMPAWFWFAFFAVYAINCFAERWKEKTSFLRSLAVFIALAFSFPSFISAVSPPPPDSEKTAEGHRDLPVLNWLNDHADKDSVIYAPSGLSMLIPIYTGDNVFFSAPVRLFFLPDSEVLDRFILASYYKDFSDDFVRENERLIFGVYYINKTAHAVQENRVRRWLGLAAKPAGGLPEEAVRRVQNRARELKAGDFEKELEKYRVDYVIWDKNDFAFNKFVKMPFLEKIGEEGAFGIFRVK